MCGIPSGPVMPPAGTFPPHLLFPQSHTAISLLFSWLKPACPPSPSLTFSGCLCFSFLGEVGSRQQTPTSAATVCPRFAASTSPPLLAKSGRGPLPGQSLNLPPEPIPSHLGRGMAPAILFFFLASLVLFFPPCVLNHSLFST